MKLLRVLLEPALLVTSSLRLVWVIASSSAVVAGSSITIVSSVSIVVSVPRSCKPATLQVHTLSQGMATPAIFGVFRAWTRQDLLCGWCAGDGGGAEPATAADARRPWDAAPDDRGAAAPPHGQRREPDAPGVGAEL